MEYLIAILTLAIGIMFTPASDDLLVATFVIYVVANDHASIPSFFITWLICFAAFTWFYGIGQCLNSALPEKKKNGRLLLKAQRLIDRYGTRVIFFSYFIPGLRHPIHYVSGFMKVPLKTYLIYNVSAAAVYSLFWSIAVRLFDVSKYLHFIS